MFTPARSAEETQLVCTKACRALRDLRLARAGRRRDLDDARVDDRARQRAHREAQAGKCHGLPSPRKCPLSPKEVRQIVDRALAPSRATLERDLRGILRGFVPISGIGTTAEGALSRATLGAQELETVGDSGANLVTPSHMSLGEGTAP